MSDPEIDRLLLCEVCQRPTLTEPPREGQCSRAMVLRYGGGPQVASCYRLGYERVRAELEAAKSSIQHYKDREAHFAKVLGVTDGGKYRADWDSAIKDVLAQLEAAKKERDEARGVEEYWKQHGKPIAAALRELTAARQSEERLRDVVFDVHHNFLSGLVGSWAAPNPPLCFCMEGGICPAIPIREDAKRFMEKTEAALAAPAPDKEKL